MTICRLAPDNQTVSLLMPEGAHGNGKSTKAICKCGDRHDQPLQTGPSLPHRGLSGPQGSVRLMKSSHHRRVHVKAVECAIFATPNPLKLQAPRNIKSPFSNTRAIISKLYRRWSPN
jgi:hypothetical protein